MQGVYFFLVNADEVIIMDNQQWINVHVDIIKGLMLNSDLTNIKELVEADASINNVIKFLLKSIVKYGGVFNEKFKSQFIKIA